MRHALEMIGAGTCYLGIALQLVGSASSRACGIKTTEVACVFVAFGVPSATGSDGSNRGRVYTKYVGHRTLLHIGSISDDMLPIAATGSAKEKKDVTKGGGG